MKRCANRRVRNCVYRIVTIVLDLFFGVALVPLIGQAVVWVVVVISAIIGW